MLQLTPTSLPVVQGAATCGTCRPATIAVAGAVANVRRIAGAACRNAPPALQRCVTAMLPELRRERSVRRQCERWRSPHRSAVLMVIDTPCICCRELTAGAGSARAERQTPRVLLSSCPVACLVLKTTSVAVIALSTTSPSTGRVMRSTRWSSARSALLMVIGTSLLCLRRQYLRSGRWRAFSTTNTRSACLFLQLSPSPVSCSRRHRRPRPLYRWQLVRHISAVGGELRGEFAHLEPHLRLLKSNVWKVGERNAAARGVTKASWSANDIGRA